MDHLSSNILMCAMLLLFYASGTVEGAAFGANCDSHTHCSEPNQRCDTTCKCKTTAITNTAGDGCILKVELEATCIDGEPTAQCVDSKATCRDVSGFKCLCTDANYKSGSVCKVKVTIDGTCDSTDTAADQCSVINTACSDDGTGAKKCLCTSNYYKSGSTCADRKAPGTVCASGQCVTNAMCSTTCTCNTGYTATPTTTPTYCESSDATIIIAHLYVFMFGIVASLYVLV